MKRHQRIRGLVVKVASRCNLNCSYCYVYNKGDTSYQIQPRFMSQQTADLLLSRVGEYCRRFRVKTFQFVFHGGEPLLAPVAFYEQFIERAGQALPSYTKVIYSLQTNGVLLDDAWCETLGKLNIRLGVSLDVLPGVHDQYRIDHKGQGSYSKTVAGLLRAYAHPSIRYYPGVLTVVDATSDPTVFLEHLLTLPARSINLLFPDQTHPPTPVDKQMFSATPYGDWLVTLFDSWFTLPVRTRPQIRLFQQIITLILGFDAPTNAIGQAKGTFLIIESDGSIEPEDSLKISKLPKRTEKLHLQTHSLAMALADPLIELIANSHSVLPAGCQLCPVRRVCGGGFIVHRYHPITGFNNPSVYCLDLLRIITHIQSTVLTWLPQRLTTQLGVQTMSYEQARTVLYNSANELKTDLVEPKEGLV